jgi:hypothetical protein
LLTKIIQTMGSHAVRFTSPIFLSAAPTHQVRLPAIASRPPRKCKLASPICMNRSI